MGTEGGLGPPQIQNVRFWTLLADKKSLNGNCELEKSAA